MKSKKYSILIILSLISIISYYYLIDRFGREYGVTKNLEYLQEELVDLSEIWRMGKTKGDEVCKKQEKTDEFFYQCNPKYFSCLIEKKIINKDRKNLEIESPYYLRQHSSYREYLYKIKISGVSQDLILKDSCHEVYLPQRFYSFLVENRKHTYDWDNHAKSIFVDKYQVRVYEILDYAKQVNDKELIEKFSKNKDSDIAYNLTKEQMNKFCHFQGKEILSANVFDAASIFPEDEQDDHSRLLRAPYYPWSRKNTQTEIYNTQEKNIEIPQASLSKLCSRVYAKDCLKFDFINYNRENISWMGMNEVLGGYFEYLTNTLYPLENIKISSIYFPLKSKVHRTGIRGYWDGEDFGINNLLIKNYEEGEIDNYKIAFRCMRQK